MQNPLLQLWQGTEADMRHGCGWEEVGYHFHEFFKAGSVPAQEMGNQGREVCAQGRFSLGLQWELMRNIGGRVRTRERVPWCREVFRRQPAATGGPRKHSLLLFLHTET